MYYWCRQPSSSSSAALAALRDSLGIANTALNNKPQVRPPSLIHQRVTQYRVLTVSTALHGIQARHSHEKTVRLSIRPSVCQTRDLRQNERMFCPYFIPYERTFILLFRHEEWLVEDDPCT